MKAVVLAAGEGTRLQPLTFTRSKHMIFIAGKPMLEYLLTALRDGGITEVFIVISHYKEMVQNYFGDGKKWNLKIQYMPQKELLGTANAIAVTEEYTGCDRFLVVYGDLLINSSVIKSALRKHVETGLDTLSAVPVKNPLHYGVVTLKNGMVEEIVEKPKAGTIRSNLVNAGVYVFSGEIFEEIRKTSRSVRGEYEITDTIKQLLDRKIKIASNTVSSEDWMDIGQPWDLLEANQRILERMPSNIRGKVEDGAHVIGTLTLKEGARVRSGAYIEGPAYIDTGSDIGPNCYIRPSTSIGKNVRIGNACEVKNSLIMDETHLGHLSYVGDSIIGQNCNLGAGTITANLRFDKGTVKVKIKEQLTDSGLTKLGVIMGDNVQTGIGSRVMPGVKIGPDSWIGPNAVLYRDIPSNMYVMQRQELTSLDMKNKD